MDKEAEKLLKAMEKDEALIDVEVAALTRARDRPIQVRIKVPGSDDVVVKGRRLRASETSAYRQALREIDPKLVTAGTEEAKEIQLSPEQNTRLVILTDRYIMMATGITHEQMEKIDDDRIRTALIMGIAKASTLSTSDLEELTKFREPA